MDSTRLTESERRAVLNELAAREAGDGDVRRRKSDRVPIPPGTTVDAEIQYIGGARTSARVAARNLSESGIGFLHGAFLHNGSLCRIIIRGKDGGVLAMNGKVVRCEHVKGRVHDVGVAFDKPISIEAFVGAIGYTDTTAYGSLATLGEQLAEHVRRRAELPQIREIADRIRAACEEKSGDDATKPAE